MTAKLVAIGDSLTQGFQHGAIRRAGWSYPSMVAAVLGADPFRHPDFDGDGDGGPLLDLEVLARALAAKYASRLDWWELGAAAFMVRERMARVEDYWERLEGTKPSTTGTLHHNLAVWGFEVLDALTLSDGACLRNTRRPKQNLIAQIPEFGMYRTARRTLNPSQAPGLEELTQLDLAERIASEEGGIENLILALGANNALATCLFLKLRWSHSADFRKLAHQRSCTIWEPEHFIKLYDRLAERLKGVEAERTFLATVPHVTIAPVCRGVSPRANADRPERVGGYYEFYTHFWIWDDDFDPDRDPHITREDARAVDGAIDEYNAHIKEVAEANGWFVIDFCEILDRIAFRRRAGVVAYEFPAGLVEALKKNEATRFRVRPDGTVLLDSRYLRLPEREPAVAAPTLDWQRAYRGGLFGLDGVHPTTIGYGIVAHEVLAAMQRAGVPAADPAKLPWDAIVAADSLVTEPPAILGSLQDTLKFMFARAQLGRLVMQVSGYGSQPQEEVGGML